MKLSQLAIGKINSETRLKLAIALKFTEFWITKLVDANKENGPLTTASALKVISEETELSAADILEEDKVNEPSN